MQTWYWWCFDQEKIVIVFSGERFTQAASLVSLCFSKMYHGLPQDVCTMIRVLWKWTFCRGTGLASGLSSWFFFKVNWISSLEEDKWCLTEDIHITATNKPISTSPVGKWGKIHSTIQHRFFSSLGRILLLFQYKSNGVLLTVTLHQKNN